MAQVGESCDLCHGDGGLLVFQHDRYRVVLVDEAAYPGFCRVIWQEHIQEMTDLAPSDRAMLMSAVWTVESTVREVMQPHKMNLASLGNMTPHLHWHVIPRHIDDAHFPSPIWAPVERVSLPAVLAGRSARLPQLQARLGCRLAALA